MGRVSILHPFGCVSSTSSATVWKHQSEVNRLSYNTAVKLTRYCANILFSLFPVSSYWLKEWITYLHDLPVSFSGTLSSFPHLLVHPLMASTSPGTQTSGLMCFQDSFIQSNPEQKHSSQPFSAIVRVTVFVIVAKSHCSKNHVLHQVSRIY